MTTASRWRVAMAVLIVLVLVARWATRPSPEGAGVVVVGTVEASDTDRGSARTRVADSGKPEEALATIILRVDVVPPDADFEWEADLYLEPTESRPRSNVSHEMRRGSATITWRARPDRFGVHVRSQHGVGRDWHEVDARDVHEHSLESQLMAFAHLTGRVLTEDGRPLSGARVAFIPTESAPRSLSVPPDIESDRPLDDGPLSAETEKDGRYEIGGVDPRVPYHGAASHPGFGVRRELGVTVSPAATTEQDFSLEVGCRVRGRLLDATGSPISGATLGVSAAQAVGTAGLAWMPEGQAESGADGGFIFDCLGPGWKKVQTVLVAAPGESMVGHWECRVERGDLHDFGDLLVRDSLYEASILSPEGGPCAPHVTFGVFPDTGAGSNADGALLLVPVTPDDRGMVRVRGLPPGRVSAVVRDDTEQADGWWRPTTRVEERFDGGHVQSEWVLLPLREGAPDARDAAGHDVVITEFTFPETGDDALAISFVNDALTSIQRISGGSLGLQVAVGDRVRLVVTDGERWGEYVLVAERDSRLDPQIRPDRVGDTLEIVVRDDGRAVPGALVFIGPAAQGADGVFPFRRTRRDGRIVLSGFPPGLPLCVTASVFGKQPEPQIVEWVAGRATVIIDVSEN